MVRYARDAPDAAQAGATRIAAVPRDGTPASPRAAPARVSCGRPPRPPSPRVAMQRIVLYIVAALFFVYEQVAFARWWRTHGSLPAGLSHIWATLRRDDMVFMMWNDMGIFTVIVLVWLWRDLTATGRSKLWLPATLVWGCVPLLVYLARHHTPATAAPRPAAAR
jgi:hypothetical protein